MARDEGIPGARPRENGNFSKPQDFVIPTPDSSIRGRAAAGIQPLVFSRTWTDWVPALRWDDGVFIETAVKHVNFVVPAKAGMTNLKIFNIFNCRLNRGSRMENSSTGAPLLAHMPGKVRQCWRFATMSKYRCGSEMYREYPIAPSPPRPAPRIHGISTASGWVQNTAGFPN